MTTEEINAQAEAFAALPRSERKEKFFALPKEVQPVARAIVEARRGISRDDKGGIILAKDTAIQTLVRYAHKDRDLDTRKANLAARSEEVRAQLLATHGEEAVAEADQAIADSFAVPTAEAATEEAAQ